MTVRDIRALAEATLEHDKAATQGPWEVDDGSDQRAGALGIAHVTDHFEPLVVPLVKMDPRDAAAIAHARTAAPDLARFALAVMEVLAEWDRYDDVEIRAAGHDIRAAIARKVTIG